MLTKSSLLWCIVVPLALLVLGEGAARTVAGLGDPVLYAADPQLEYMLKPNQDVTRFGNRILVNEYGMRSESFPAHKRSKDELRVLVMGDSVVNGGNHIDHGQLATTLAQENLRQATDRSVSVGNVSAGSWGPANLLAWARRYGFMEADVVVMVLSSHDASDVPTFVPLDPQSQPTAKPVSALAEGLMGFVSMYLRAAKQSSFAETQADLRPPNTAALQAFRELTEAARGSGACVCLAQHATRAEAAGAAGPGHRALQEIAADMHILGMDDAAELSEVARREGSPYRDNIHLNQAGQRVLAGLLTRAAEQCVRVRHARAVTSALSSPQ